MREFKMKPLAVALALALALPAGVQAQNSENTSDRGMVEEVIITGRFASSLADALNAKRSAVNSRESIMAEDIGKMPDLNLAESMQRVPGVAISREGGEGRQITVRGLGPEFTRTTLNGMEVPASTDGLDSSGALNSSRAFDFNVFASEMFNRIDIHKTPTASVEEGGIAGTVDLYTGKPFDMPGFHASVSGQAAYNDMGGDIDPRVAAMVSNTFADDTVGVLFSIAQTKRNVRQEGFGTVRYTSPYENGTSWGDTAGTAVSGTPDRDAVCPTVADGGPVDALDCMWHPRLPRMDYFGNEQDRLGATAAVQWRPSDRLELGLDLVHSSFENARESYNFFAQFRNLQGDITPQSLTLDPTGTHIVAGEFEGVKPRSESRGTFSETKFNQVVVNGSYELTDNMTVSGLIGNATSDFHVEQYRFNMTAIDPMSFMYSFEANPNIAEMSYGADITDPANFEFSGPTIRRNEVDRDNTTAKVDLEIRGDSSSVKVGLILNDREVGSREYDADRTQPDSLDGLTQTLPVDDFASGLDGVPEGFPRDWLMNDFDATIAAYDVGPWEPDVLSNWLVQEKSTGAYGEFETAATLLDLPLNVSAGLRVVETRTTASGTVDRASGPAPVVQETNYTDVLPSTNITWELRDDFQLRFSAARSMSRPGLGALSPSVEYDGLNGTVSGANEDLSPQRANSVDLSAEWYFADDALLAATVFYKDIESFIATETVNQVPSELIADLVRSDPEFDASWQSLDVPWEFSRPTNNDGAELKGMEFIYQQPFNFLPGAGVAFNYMIVDSQSQYGSGERTITSDLIGMSDKTTNVTFYYETDVYGARISANDRSDYLTRVPGRNGNGAEATTGPTRIDASAFYNITDNVTVTLEAINLSNETERLYTTGYNNSYDFVREYNTTGRQIFLGVRADF